MSHTTKRPYNLRIARILGGLATVLLSIDLVAGAPPLLSLLAAVDLIALVVMRRRRFRFAIAVWFGVRSFAHLMNAVWAPGEAQLVLAIAAAAAGAGASTALLWPRLRARRKTDPLPPLPMSWALMATLLASIADIAMLRSFGATDDTLLVHGAANLIFFGGLAVASQFGPLHWIGAALAALAAGTLSLEVLDDAQAFTGWVTTLGAATTVLAFDWMRSGGTGRARFVRSATAIGVLGLIPVVIASPSLLFDPIGLVGVLGRAAAFGVAVGLAPRIGRQRRMVVTDRPGLVGSPRGWIKLLLLVPPVALGLLGFAEDPDELVTAVALALLGATISGLALIRARILLATFTFICGAIILGFVGAASAPRNEEWFSPVILGGATVVAALLAFMVSSPRATGYFSRRWRIRLAPARPLHLGLAGATAAACAIILAVGASSSPTDRPNLISGITGPTFVNAPLFAPPHPLQAIANAEVPQGPVAVGATVATDPTGRGTWVVDADRNEVTLIHAGAVAERHPVGAWPERLLVDEAGWVYVSSRRSGRIDVIQPEGTRRSILVGTEPRALAADPERGLLYVALVTGRALVAVDTSTQRTVGRFELEDEPAEIAVTPQGVAVLPQRAAYVDYVSADLRSADRVPLYGGGRQSWHGHALVPMGDDLLVIHAAVDTGLSQPVPSGGYGGGVREPIELLATVLESGRPALYPPEMTAARRLNLPDVAGAAIHDGQLVLASKTRGVVLSCDSSGISGIVQPDLELQFSCTPHRMDVGLAGVAIDPAGDVTVLAAYERELVTLGASGEGGNNPGVRLGKGTLDSELALGRKLFHTVDARIASAEMACITCHPDGRDDGLVWRLQGERRQTVFLAGRMADTAPYNWVGTTDTLHSNIKQTIERLGGSGLTRRETRALARFIREGLPEPMRAPSRHQDVTLVAQGHEVFEDDDVGCSGCHEPALAFQGTGNHDVGSTSEIELREMQNVDPKARPLEFDTPSLRYAALSAPYFHDGSVASLEELIDTNHDRMGKTSHLSRDQKRALVAYLESL